MHVTRWDAYLTRLRSCQTCGKVFEKKANSGGKFCSHSCSAKHTNLRRGPISEEHKQKTSKSLKEYYAGASISIANRRARYADRREQRKCIECGTLFEVVKSSATRRCSRACASASNSAKMIQKIIERGTTNFSTKQGAYTYGPITVDCDSKLEAAAVKYLVDHMGARSIERCTSIINYRDPEGKPHKFLPDFYVRTDNERWIVEVKQVWRHATRINSYNRYFDEKRAAMRAFCEAKNLNSLWLDFDHDKRFEAIYRKMIAK